MARNPAAFQEMLRSQDRQLSNIEVRYITQGIDVVCCVKRMGIHGMIKEIHFIYQEILECDKCFKLCIK